MYTAPWGDVLKIEEVKTYWKVSDRPFYDEMSDDEKKEIRKYSEDMGLPYEFIKFSRSTVWLYFTSNKFPLAELSAGANFIIEPELFTAVPWKWLKAT